MKRGRSFCWRLSIAVVSIGVMMLTGLGANGADDVMIETVSFEGWDNCYRITNGNVELIAVTEIGPRILRFGFVDGRNMFGVSESTAGQTGGDEWQGYGGHRFWIAPETDFTYYPDNDPVRVDVGENRLVLTSPPELVDPERRSELTPDEIFTKLETDPEFRDQVSIQKVMTITMSDDGEVTVEHQANNVGVKTLDIAPWALTVMDQEGLAIIPNAPYAPHGPGHFLPVRSMILWSYTDLSDPRLSFLDDYITLRQDPNREHPLKLGFSYTEGWAAYALDGNLFVKYMEALKDAAYPDMGSSVELFTNGGILEIESLGPKHELAPGQTMTLTERWKLLPYSGEIKADNESVKGLVESVGLE